MESISPVDAWLRAAIVYNTDLDRGWPAATLGEELLGKVLWAAPREKLLETLVEGVVARSFKVDGPRVSELEESHRLNQINSLLVEQKLARCAVEFENRQIPFRVLKGLANAYLLYNEPTWRSAGDLDILVPGERFNEVVSILRDDFGGDHGYPGVRPDFNQEFGKSEVVRLNEVEVDVHRTFVAGPFGLTVELDELFQNQSTFAIGGRGFPALGAAHLFIQGCFNVALNDIPVRLGSVRDVLLTVQNLSFELDEAIEIATRWKCQAVLKRAADVVTQAVGAQPDWARTMAAVAVPKRQELLLRSYLAPGATYWRQLASVAVIRGIGPRVRYVRAIAFPGEEYLRRRSWTQTSHLNRALRRIRHAR